MAITDVQVDMLLAEVKKSLAIFYNSEDITLKRLILSIIDIMRKSGINDEQIISDSGIAQIVILTSDFWRSGGNYNISKDAYFLLNTLNYSASRGDENL
jgi:hypothetical protein